MTKNNSDAVKIGQKIKQLRRNIGLTQEQLAEKIGIDNKLLSRIETGRCFPSLKITNELTKIFRFNFLDLMETYQIEKIEIPDNYYTQSINILNSANTKQERKFYLDALKHTQKCLKHINFV